MSSLIFMDNNNIYLQIIDVSRIYGKPFGQNRFSYFKVLFNFDL